MKPLKYLLFIVFVVSISSCKTSKKEKLYTKEVDTLLSQTPKIVELAVDTSEIVMIVQETEPVMVKSEPVMGYTSDKYYMIVGSFLSEKLAVKYANTVLDMGYQPNVIYSSEQGYYRVSAQSYNDKSTAVSDISSFRSSVTNHAWVHVKN